MPAFETRQVGRTDVRVTSLGLGTATMGGTRIKVTRQQGEDIVSAAWDAGVRFVDTAPFYGIGAAEHRVGDAMRDKPRNEWVLSTKCGRLLRPTKTGRIDPMPFDVIYDYSYDGIMRSVEDSYQRLGLDKIDLLLVHDIGVYQHGEEDNARHFKALADSGVKALAELKKSGEIKGVGIGVNEKEVLLASLKIADWDAFLLAGRYTLLEQGPVEDLLPECLARGTSIIVGGPLNSGILAGRETWNYAAAPAEVVSRVKRIQAVCDAHNVSMPAAAMQFPLAHPAVCAVIPGPRTAAEFNENLPLFSQKIPAAFWAEMKAQGLIHAAAPVPA